MKSIKKIFKIEFILLKLNFETILEYRLNTVFSFFGSLFYNFGAILFLSFLFNKINLISGWDKWDLILLYGVGQMLGYLYLFATHSNNQNFSSYVRNGDFDIFLTKPVNSLIYSTLRLFAYEHLIGLIQPLAIIFYAISNKFYPITIFGIFLSIISILISFIIIHFLNVLALIPSFKILENEFWRFYVETNDISNYPYEILDNKFLKFTFFVIIPYALLVNIPFRALIGRLDYHLLLLQIIVCIGFVVTTNFLWNLAVKNYESASS